MKPIRVTMLTLGGLLAASAAARADMGFPRFSTPDWSSLTTPQWIGLGVGLSGAVICLGFWVARHPRAAASVGVGCIGLPGLLLGLVGFGSLFSGSGLVGLVFGAFGLGFAAVLGYTSTILARRSGGFGGKELLPALIGLALMVGCLGLFWSQLRWIPPESNQPPSITQPPLPTPETPQERDSS